MIECRLADAFLRSGRMPSGASHCAAVIAAGGVLLAHAFTARVLFAASLLCWPVACYCGLRVAIDAALFREMSSDPEAGAEAVDELLRSWGMANAKPGRSIAERSRGAIRLWKQLTAAVAVQLLSLTAAMVVQAVS